MKKIRTFFVVALLLPAASLSAQVYFSFGYGPSFPLGDTKEYIDQASWRNFNMEIGFYVAKNFSVGSSFSWYGSYQDYPFRTWSNIQGSTVTVTGQQWRYGNNYPLTFLLKYYLHLKTTSFRPYIGAGLGPYFTNRQIDLGVWSVKEYFVQFGFYPELGLSYWFKRGFALSMEGRYNYSVKTSELPSQSNIAVSIGLIWKIK
jgi:hypothetical protein